MDGLRDVLDSWTAARDHGSIRQIAGGFSGAAVYRVETGAQSFCLRGWPGGRAGLPRERILELHRWLAWLSSGGISEIAVPLPTVDGLTLASHNAQWWQLEPWMPGTADFDRNPSTVRLRNIVTALARLHLASERYVATPSGRQWFATRQSPSPAVNERLASLQRLSAFRSATVPPTVFRADARQARLADRMAAILPQVAPPVADEMVALTAETVRLHPCLRDVWHDHILLAGDKVTGIIDPSAARTESVASDLSRLLGSLLGDDASRWETALESYSRVRPLSPIERRLVGALDRSGVILSAAHWLEKMGETTLDDRSLRRVEVLAERVSSLASRLH